MIFDHLQKIYGTEIAEEVIIEVMAFLGRLPHSYFVCRERDTCPRISCAHSVVWFSYLSELGEVDAIQNNVDFERSGNYTIQLYGKGNFEYAEFSSPVLEVIAREIDRHESEMRMEQVKMFADDQIGIDTGIKRNFRRLS